MGNKRMKKFNELKEAIQNPPPERLASVEYKSHFLQILGITLVCIVLIVKGFWYIIFAFIFGVGISYSQGMSAYQKYKMIMSVSHPEDPINYENDISPTRRRSKIVDHVLGGWAKWSCIIVGVLAPILLIDPTLNRFILMVVYPLTFALTYAFCYFMLAYWISYPIYKNKYKGGKK